MPDECSAPQDISFFGGSDSAWVAQLVERVLGKDEVTGSIPVPGSRIGWASERKRRGVTESEFFQVGRGTGFEPATITLEE